mgnify:FL=1
MILVDGKPRSTLEATDRGLFFGDGLFETMAAMGASIPLWERHLQRLAAGCRRLRIPLPRAEALWRDIEAVLPRESERSVIKLVVTRGSGGDGYRPPQVPHPTCLVQRRDWPVHATKVPQAGVRVRFCETRMATGSPVAGIKHLNRLEQVLARAEWQDAEIAEGLMLDRDGYVVEGTMSNLFLQEGDRWLTPPVDRCGVAGVMRGLVMEMAGTLGYRAVEQRVRPSRLLAADAVFLTNAVVGIWPIGELEGRRLAVTPGVLAARERVLAILGGQA